MRAKAPIPRFDPPRRRSAELLFTAILLVYLTTAGGSLSSNWFGGRSYGTRYLLPILPLLLARMGTLGPLLRRPRTRMFLLALVVSSAFVQLPGVLVDYSKVADYYVRAGAILPLRERLYSWTSSPLALNCRAAWQAVVDPPEPRAVGAPDWTRQREALAFDLDFWWLLACRLRSLPCWAGVLAGLGPLAAGAGLLVIVASPQGRQSVRTGSVS